MREFIPCASPTIGGRERRAVDRVLRTANLAQGIEVQGFENEFAALVDGRDCVAVNSGTSALLLGLLSLGLSPGDEVLVPSFTFAATANAVVLAGAVPVFVDIEPAHYCMDSEAAERAISSRTRAIMPVHLYGHPAAMKQLASLAARQGLALLEDAAQAHGASLDGVPVGAWGDVAAFSFYPTKNMTSGEGGMLVTPKRDLARRVRLLRNQGMEARYRNEIVGFNLRMSDIHAAIGRAQLHRLEEMTRRRVRNAAFLTANLQGVPAPRVAQGAVHVYHQYTVRIADDRDGFARALEAEHQVGTGIYYPVPVHRLPAYDFDLDLHETARAAREVLSLPVHPALSGADLDRIVTAVAAVARAGAS